MTLQTKRRIQTFLRYFVLIAVGLVMVYPLLWMVGATFKDNREIFAGIGLIPKNPTLEGYKNAMKSYGGDINIWKSMLNTYSYVIPKVIFTIVSSTITAYGFGRFNFKGKGILFAVLMSTLFLPQVVLNVPQFVLFSKLNWVDSRFYLPIIVPTLFATETYFVFMLIQFLRNVPKELDEAAKIDGCTAIQTLVKVIVPMLMPAIVSCALFQFMWSSNDFMGPLLAYFDGLPEKKIEEIRMENITFDFAKTPKSGVPAMSNGVTECSRRGIFVSNVSRLVIKNVSVSGQDGEAEEFVNVDSVERLSD